MTDVTALEAEIASAITAAADETALEAVRVAALGKSGSISALLKTLGSMTPDERKANGPIINGLKDRVTARSPRGATRSRTPRSTSGSTPKRSMSRCRCARPPQRQAAFTRSAR